MAMVLPLVEHPYDETVESRRVGSAWAAALAFDAVFVGFRACYHVGCRDAVATTGLLLLSEE